VRRLRIHKRKLYVVTVKKKATGELYHIEAIGCNFKDAKNSLVYKPDYKFIKIRKK
jgi:hypothetical protein